MIAKTFEIRDTATFIPALAVKLEPGNERDQYLLARAGYGISPENQGEYILLCKLEGTDCHYDIYNWGTRTMQIAHDHIQRQFDELESGAVVDVEYLLGLSLKPKISEESSVNEAK